MSRKWDKKHHVEANGGGLERSASRLVDTVVRQCRFGVRRGGTEARSQKYARSDFNWQLPDFFRFALKYRNQATLANDCCTC